MSEKFPPRIWAAVANLSFGEEPEWFMQVPYGAASWEETNEHDQEYIHISEHEHLLAQANADAKKWKQFHQFLDPSEELATLEAKLAVAVEALDFYASGRTDASRVNSKLINGCTARDVLARIKEMK